MKRSASWLAAVVLATAVGFVPTTRASAAVPAVKHYESPPTPSSSSSPKTAVAYCPAGTSVLGGGGQVMGAHGQVALVAAHPVYQPFAAPGFQHSFRVTAAEDKDGTLELWSLKASVYCASGVVTQVVSATSEVDSEKWKEKVAECPEGKFVVGAGGFVSLKYPDGELDAQVSLVGFRPGDDLTTVTATATEPSGPDLEDQFGGMWSVTAVAVCGYLSAFDGLELQEATVTEWLSPIGDHDVWLWAYCSPGKRLLGAGVDLADPVANTYLAWAIRSNVMHTKVSARATLNDQGAAPSVDLTAYAICVKS